MINEWPPAINVCMIILICYLTVTIVNIESFREYKLLSIALIK